MSHSTQNVPVLISAHSALSLFRTRFYLYTKYHIKSCCFSLLRQNVSGCLAHTLRESVDPSEAVNYVQDMGHGVIQNINVSTGYCRAPLHVTWQNDVITHAQGLVSMIEQ